MKVLKLFLIGLLSVLSSHGQNNVTSINTLPNRVKFYTLNDTITKTKFQLDSSRTVITAIDDKGKTLWATNPWKDNRIEKYIIDNPQIISFHFTWPDHFSKEVIVITYNNRQFGFINKSTGEFHFVRQD